MGVLDTCFLIALAALVSCSNARIAQTSAPFPGISYALTDEQKNELEKKAMAGDAASARRMAHYFILFEGDERVGISWLEKAGDLGDIEARGTVLRFFRKGGDEDKKKTLELEQRWGIPSSVRK